MTNLQRSADKALKMLRSLPRVQIGNIRPNPNSKQSDKRGRGQHGGDKHGAGNKGSGQRQNFMRLGYETGNTPFYLRFPYEPYYKGHHLRREYPRISLSQLQILIDTSRVDTSSVIDVTTLINTGVFNLHPEQRQFGFHLTDEGAERFCSKICIEVQHAKESVIAAVERNGGVIKTTYYDPRSLQILVNPRKWFEKCQPIPKRMLPPQDCVNYYTLAKNRGYLANPTDISHERLVLSQKYGYPLPQVDESSLTSFKDPRQIFYGFNPGWVISLNDKAIIKPKNESVN